MGFEATPNYGRLTARSAMSTSQRRHTELIILLGALTAFAPMSIDMYLPALPTIGQAFSATPGHVQLSLASFFLGLAIGQAIYGPLADRFGRKRPLLVGLCLLVIASAGCALAASIDILIALRFFQALGACSGQVIARAIVRDVFEAREAVRVFSLMVLVLGVSPVLAPVLGGQILVFFDWRVIFWVIMILAAIGLAGTVWRLPETHRHEHMRPLALKSVLGAYGLLLADRAFVGYALTGATGLAGMFAYIAGSPFVFMELFHVPTTKFGFFFAANALGLIAAAQLNVRLVRRFHSDAVILAVLLIQVIDGLLLLTGTWTGWIGLYGTALFIFIYVASVGCLFPNTTALAMASHPQKAGSASALVGVLQFSLAAFAASIVGGLNNGTALPMAGTIALCGVAAMTFYRSLTHTPQL
jgi:DHA1 family bicyclomycin/chloramphenicol resistance-like MFS transporter